MFVLDCYWHEHFALLVFFSWVLWASTVWLCMLCFVSIEVLFSSVKTALLFMASPSIKDSSTQDIDGIHVFESEYSSTECTVVISFVPPPSSKDGDSHLLCLKLSIPGLVTLIPVFHILKWSILQWKLCLWKFVTGK